jgi:hypothetical protein
MYFSKQSQKHKNKQKKLTKTALAILPTALATLNNEKKVCHLKE